MTPSIFNLAPEWSEEKYRQNDLDATHNKTHSKSHFGDELSVNVDIKHRFTRKIAPSKASEHDEHHFDAVLDQHNTERDVYADSAYPSKRRQEMLKALGWRDGMQRRSGTETP